MPFDPMQGFEVGQKIGSSKKSSLNRTSDYMSDLFKTRDAAETKASSGLEKIYQTAMIKNAIPKRETGVYSWNPTTGKFEQEATVPQGSIVRNTTTTDDVSAKKTAEKSVTGAGAESGKMAFIKVALREGLPSVKQTLFPDGTPKSFNRSAATQSTIMGGGPLPFSKEGQKVYRELGSALAARRYMITGQASNATEVKEMVNQFMSQWGSDPDNMYQGINQIESEFNEYLKTADPSGLFHEGGGQTSTHPSPTEDPRERLKKRLMQKGLM